MTTELTVVEDGEVVETAAPITLFGTTDPVAVVDRASTIATALADVIKTRQLFKRIGARDHVFVEGWTLLGSMLGVFAEVEWSRPLEDNRGWECRAVARTLAGRTVGAAESMCSRSESKWTRADDYAIRSMAQTRAVSKALRLPLGFIMELAGYSATPAEELSERPAQTRRNEREPVSDGTEASVADPAPSSAEEGVTPPPTTAYRREELVQVAREKGLGFVDIERYAALAGIEEGATATPEQMDRLILMVAGHGTDQPLDLQLEPPKPRTDEYRALSPVQKAEARAYWETQGATA